MLNIDYVKILHHNYMEIKHDEEMIEDMYCIKMLSHKVIDGVLVMERRIIDNEIYYYYDITRKQAVSVLWNTLVLSFDKITVILKGIINAIDNSIEYLLIEDDFVISPECVYMDFNNNIVYLSYVSGYRKDIKEQISSFIEYMMNRIDYKDKEAVLLIYDLYGISKEDEYSFVDLLFVLEGSEKQGDVHIEVDIEEKIIDERKADEENIIIPVMNEELISEKEMLYWPYQIYLYTAACILGGILIIYLSFMLKFVYNSLGTRIEIGKMFFVALTIISLESYGLMKIWDKKNQMTKIIEVKEYYDTINEPYVVEWPSIEDVSNTMEEYDDKNGSDGMEEYDGGDRYDEENPTCLLREVLIENKYVLKANSPDYGNIELIKYPFVIGKAKNVDYSIENEMVSRYHCKIHKNEDRFLVTDLNSTNGTFINGDQVAIYEEIELKLGDEVTFAHIKYNFIKQ